MNPTRRLGAFAATAAAALAFAGTAGAHPLTRSHTQASAHGAVFVQTNNPAGNAIDVYARGPRGALTAAGSYPTGGDGGQAGGSTADHLASQGSLVYDAKRSELFAVNAGSNTITTFAVLGDTLVRLQVLSSGGDFPVSIAVHDGLVYVLNALDGGSIQGYRRSGDLLTPLAGSDRALGLDASAMPQFLTTPGQIAFTPSGRQLLVSTKDNGNDIDVFRVSSSGTPSATPTVNSEPGTLPFAFAFARSGEVAVATPGNGSVEFFTLAGNGTLTLQSTVVTGQAATCWLTADGRFLFAGNAGSASESSVLAPRHSTPSRRREPPVHRAA